MGHTTRGIAAAALMVAGCATMVPTGVAPFPGVGGQIVLRYQPGTSAVTQAALSAEFGAKADKGKLPDSARWILPKGVDPATVLVKLASNPAIKFAEPNYIRHIMGYAAPAAYNSTVQWNLPQIHAPDAWQQYFSAAHPPGKGVVVAILDSGVDVRHPDLAPNIAKDSSGNVIFLDEVHPTSDGTSDIDTSTWEDFDWSTAYNNNCPSGYTCPGPDGNGHGTHVAGIVAAAGSEVGYKGAAIVGVAPGATILPVKIMHNDGNGDDWAISNGMVDAADAGAKIENMSIGGPDSSHLLDDAVTYAQSKGVLIVVAAGESLPTGGPVYYPAAYPGCLAVGAVDKNNVYQAYSNFGPQVALVAPGGTVDFSGGILSTLPTYGSELASEINSTTDYGRVSGTSQSTPEVSGVAAMIWSLYPDLTAAQVRERLVASADPLGGVDFSDQTGWGLVDAVKALALGDPRYGS